ncbi:MAG: hypothetical protein H6997_07540 [Moraxellaceae bacterium]|nr:hypothetical protein [Moraxellaceae bacterium]
MATFDELIIWDSQVHGAVTSFAEASSFVEALYNMPFKASQRLENFIQALNQTDSLQNISYKEEPTTASFRVQLLSHATWAKDCVTLVKLALEQQLTIYFENESLLFLPDGRISPKHRTREWNRIVDQAAIKPSKKSFPDNFTDFHYLVLNKLKPIMRHHGFSLACEYMRTASGNNSTAIFSLRTEYGTQELYFYGQDVYGDFRARFSLHVYSPVITCIYHEYSLSKRDDWIFNIGHSELNAQVEISLNDCVFTHKELEEHFIYLEKYLLRFADEAKTLIGLDNILNGEHELSQKKVLQDSPHEFERYAPNFLTVAKLANNRKHFDELSKLVNNSLIFEKWPYLTQYQPIFLELVNKLNNIDPNEFWQTYRQQQEQYSKQEALRQQILKDNNVKADEVADLGNQWLDNETQLIWQRTCYGQTLKHGQWLMSHDPARLKIQDALRLMEDAKALGWRIPFEEELIALITKLKNNSELLTFSLGTKHNINGHFITQKQTPSGNIEFVLTKFNDGMLGPASTNDGFLRLVKSVNP